LHHLQDDTGQSWRRIALLTAQAAIEVTRCGRLERPWPNHLTPGTE
jgi:hypothetical protein